MIFWQESLVRFNREKLLAEALEERIRRFKAKRFSARREWYGLGFRDGWKAALTGVSAKSGSSPDPASALGENGRSPLPAEHRASRGGNRRTRPSPGSS
jgi:hypothetical protein